MSKKIYVEAGSFYGHRSGVGRYALCVTEAMIRQRKNDDFVLFNFVRPGKQVDKDFSVPENTHFKFIRWFPGRAFSLLMRSGISLPLELFGLSRADILIFPNFVAWASIFRKKRIIVVHDVSFAFFPQYIQAKNLKFLRSQLTKSLKRSVKIVAVSEATKRDIVKHFNTPSEKIAVVHNAVDHKVFNPDASRRVKPVLKKYDLPDKYIIFVGNQDPRKNLEGLLKAYEQSFDSHKTALVFVGGGKWSWNNERFETLLKELAHLPIYRTGFIPDDEMSALYAHAQAFVYPSFYEGFGIPCLEAMACGCAVVCGNTSSFPEIVGDAAIMVDPHDTKAIASSITKLMTDTKLRRSLVAKGLKQAANFSWEKSAEKLSEVVDEVVS